MIKTVKGLTASEVAASKDKHGDNSLIKEKTKGFFRKFLENLSDPIIKVLLVAVFIEIVFTFGHCNWWETGGIIAAVLIATVVSTVSEYGSEKAFAKMQRQSEKSTASVLRDGQVRQIPINDVVVGDVLYLTAGKTVPADGTIIYGKVSVDQSALNGESIEVTKQPSPREESYELSSESRVFRGSTVCEGEGILKVDRVGKNTYYGMVAKDVQAETRESPLKLRLSQLAGTISKIGYFMAFIVGITYLFFTLVADNSFDFDKVLTSLKDIPYIVSVLTHALTLMITVIVVAVPEGLPMMITVVLSANMRRMLSDKIMVKKLVGIETAGSMNILFTDKTGTLTTGKMSVERIITVENSFKRTAALRKHEKIFRYLNISAKDGCALMSGINGGNSTDRALYNFFSADAPSVAKVSAVLPFSSERKFSSVTLSDGEIIIRGAPEIILSKCTRAVNGRGEIQPFDIKDIYKKYRDAAASGERVIATAVILADGTQAFVALIVLKDKLRGGVRDSVNQMQRAGVQVVMVTGDSRETAAAIAMECGILNRNSEEAVITRDDLDSMTDDELKRILPKLRVVARALPSDKTRLVRVSQEQNLVVGMTGDGINDAPSLKLADVGFAMGSGTDIAKSAGDIVILDNSFFAIVKTVLYGRTIFKSIRKFISFQLMMNLAACGVSLIGQFIGLENPITIVQMLWVNIIMDTLGGLAFAGEAPLEYYMLEKPKSREEKILSRDMLHQVLITGGYTLFMCVLFLELPFFKTLFRYDSADSYFLTGFYALFVFAGIFNCFNARSERMNILSNIGKNKPFIMIMLVISLIQILMIYFGGELFRCTPLTFREFLNILILSASVILFDIARRIFKKLSAKK